MTTIEDLQTRIESEIQGILTRIERTVGPELPDWLDITNGKRGVSIEWWGDKVGVSSLSAEEDPEPEMFTDIGAAVRRVTELLTP